MLQTQVYSSAWPLSNDYGYAVPDFGSDQDNQEKHKNIATLILEATYEHVLHAAVAHRDYHKKKDPNSHHNIVVLTRPGGGEFGNKEEWIDNALNNALHKFRFEDLDVRLDRFDDKLKNEEQMKKDAENLLENLNKKQSFTFEIKKDIIIYYENK